MILSKEKKEELNKLQQELFDKFREAAILMERCEYLVPAPKEANSEYDVAYRLTSPTKTQFVLAMKLPKIDLIPSKEI